MTKLDQNSDVQTSLEKQKVDAITEKANKLATRFNAESEADNIAESSDKSKTRTEVIKMTPRQRMEFFRDGGKFKEA